MKNSVTMRRWVPWLGFALFGAAACEVVVGETELTTVHCQAEGALGPPACAVGQVCRNGVCVSGSSADGGGGTSGTGGTGVSGTGGGGTGGGGTGGGGTGGTAGNPDAGDASDTSVDAPDDGVPPEVGPDVPTDTPVDVPPDVAPDAPLIDFGLECTANHECASQFCLQVPGLSISVCARHCCSSVECPAGAVCSPAYGADACFPASLVSLGALGSGPVGSTCGSPADCRSGQCVGNKCRDVCCSSANCAGNACSWQGSAWYCGTNAVGSGTSNWASCGGDSECESNSCWALSGVCVGACCSDDDCAVSPLNGYCDYFSDNGNAVRQCRPWGTLFKSDHKPCCSDANCPMGQHCGPIREATWNGNLIVDTTDDVWGMRCQ